MNPVVRAVSIYVILLVLLRLSGKRTFSELSTFDFVLLLVISETTQQALVADDFSVTNAVILVASFIGIDVLLSFLKGRFPTVARITDGLPVVLMEEGHVHMERMRKARVDVQDILQQARIEHGLESLDDIKYVVLEHNGGISVIPKKTAGVE